MLQMHHKEGPKQSTNWSLETVTFPDDLPEFLFYRLGTAKHPVSLPTLPRQSVRYISSSGLTDAASVCPRIPYGAQGWRVDPEDAWHDSTRSRNTGCPF
jgi:hypothetical protein